MQKIFIIAYAMLSFGCIHSMQLDSPPSSPEHIRIPRNSAKKSVEIDTELQNLGLPTEEIKPYTDIDQYLSDHKDLYAYLRVVFKKLSSYLKAKPDDVIAKNLAIKFMNGTPTEQDALLGVITKEPFYQQYTQEENSDLKEAVESLTSYYERETEKLKKAIREKDEKLENQETIEQIIEDYKNNENALKNRLEELKEENEELKNKYTVLRDHDQKGVDAILDKVNELENVVKKVASAAKDRKFKTRYKEAYDQWVLWEKKYQELYEEHIELKKENGKNKLKIDNSINKKLSKDPQYKKFAK